MSDDLLGAALELGVLLLAYYFPPIGGAGVQRSLKFARYLPEFGLRVSIVTGLGLPTGRWTPIDESLAAEIPRGTEVLRARTREPSTGGLSGDRVRGWLALDSTWSRWWIGEAMSAALRASNTDCIVASASPYSSIDAAALIADRLEVPWIADLRDPWALDEMMVYPTDLHRQLERRRMRRLLSSASAVVMNTPEAVKQVVEAFPELTSRPVVSIPNGYDADDFQRVAPASKDCGKFRIVHAGYLHTVAGLQERHRSGWRRRLGGVTPGVDILTRSHVFLLAAIDRLLEHDPSLAGRLEVHFAGVISDIGREFAGRSSGTVVHGYLPHRDSIALIRSADLLFLPQQNVGPGRRSSTIPGKTYEYLASGRPILGAVPAGDTRDLLAAAGHSVCEPDDVESIAQNIAVAIARHDANLAPTRLDAGLIRRFERRRLAGELAELVRDVTVGVSRAKAG
jgi:glycosyltransferase involved in cell wall biosynthesis